MGIWSSAEIRQIAERLGRTMPKDHPLQCQMPKYMRDLEIPAGEARIGFRHANKCAARGAARQSSEEASQLPKTHPVQSSRLALFSNQASAIDLRRNRLTFMPPLPQFCKRWPFCDFLDFGQQVVRKRRSCKFSLLICQVGARTTLDLQVDTRRHERC